MAQWRVDPQDAIAAGPASSGLRCRPINQFLQLTGGVDVPVEGPVSR